MPQEFKERFRTLRQPFHFHRIGDEAEGTDNIMGIGGPVSRDRAVKDDGACFIHDRALRSAGLDHKRPPDFSDGSAERKSAHVNLRNIRTVLARRGSYAGEAVFDNKAVLWRRSHPFGGKQEKIQRGLAVLDEDASEDTRRR
jgi:hypothetical protein